MPILSSPSRRTSRHRAQVGTLGLAVCMALLPSCTPFDPNLGVTPFRCAVTEPRCPTGYLCVNDVCTLHGEPKNDAGVSYDTGRFAPDASPICSDADYEPNNTTMQASVLKHQDVTLLGMAICPQGDVDYYSIFLKNGQTLTVDVFENPTLGEIDAQITDGKSPLVSSSGAMTDQHLTYTATADNTYYIYTRGVTTAVNNGYSLQVALTP